MRSLLPTGILALAIAILAAFFGVQVDVALDQTDRMESAARFGGIPGNVRPVFHLQRDQGGLPQEAHRIQSNPIHRTGMERSCPRDASAVLDEVRLPVGAFAGNPLAAPLHAYPPDLPAKSPHPPTGPPDFGR